MPLLINGIPSEEFEEHVRREQRHKILESAALQVMVKLREEGLLPTGYAVCVSTYDNAQADGDSYGFAKVVTDFKRDSLS